MADYARLERALTDSLQLTRRPVAVAFSDTVPAGVPHLEGSRPSGCTFWGMAAEGRVFYTMPADHYNCPIGSYTHNIALPADRAHELSDTLSLMGEIGYIRMEEVPGVPQLPNTPAFTTYAPLGDTPVTPAAVIVTGRPGGLMLLHEAAARTGKTTVPLLGRPTCMAIPAALASGGVASSLGCIGNRVYTALADEEFYTVISGDALDTLMQETATITAANVMLATYHHERRETLTAP
jgi:uncharacterized protein (DUF169 family)